MGYRQRTSITASSVLKVPCKTMKSNSRRKGMLHCRNALKGGRWSWNRYDRDVSKWSWKHISAFNDLAGGMKLTRASIPYLETNIFYQQKESSTFERKKRTPIHPSAHSICEQVPLIIRRRPFGKNHRIPEKRRKWPSFTMQCGMVINFPCEGRLVLRVI